MSPRRHGGGGGGPLGRPTGGGGGGGGVPPVGGTGRPLPLKPPPGPGTKPLSPSQIAHLFPKVVPRGSTSLVDAIRRAIERILYGREYHAPPAASVVHNYHGVESRY